MPSSHVYDLTPLGIGRIRGKFTHPNLPAEYEPGSDWMPASFSAPPPVTRHKRDKRKLENKEERTS
jgi:hypothetical protein